jgi:hypothetical protein
VELPEGLVAVVKRDCPTCVLVEPVLRQLGAAVWSQDDPSWFDPDDTDLELSYRLGIETVPTLLRSWTVPRRRGRSGGAGSSGRG